MPAVRTLVRKIGADFAHYFQEGKVYKSLKRMYSIYKLQGKKAKLVRLSTLFNSKTGFKYSLSSNLKAIELLLEHYNDLAIQNLVKANLRNLENTIGVNIRSVMRNEFALKERLINESNSQPQLYVREKTLDNVQLQVKSSVTTLDDETAESAPG